MTCRRAGARSALTGIVLAAALTTGVAGCAEVPAAGPWAPRAAVPAVVSVAVDEGATTASGTAGPVPQSAPGLDARLLYNADPASPVAARWGEIPGDPSFTSMLRDRVLTAVAEHAAATGVPYTPAADAPALTPHARGCVAGSTSRPAAELLADPTFTPASEGGAPVLTVTCEIVSGAGTVIAEALRIVTSAGGQVTSDETTVYYAETGGAFITTSDRFLSDDGLRSLLADTVQSLKVQAGALRPEMVQSPAEFPVEQLRATFAHLAFGVDGSLVVRLPGDFSVPELAQLASAGARGADGGTGAGAGTGGSPSASASAGAGTGGSPGAGAGAGGSPSASAAAGATATATAGAVPAAGPAEARIVTVPAALATAMLSDEGRQIQAALASATPLSLPAPGWRGDEDVDCTLFACVAVTFDDGPGQYTSAVLDALAERHAAATFFVQGYRAEQNPGVLQRADAEGHQLGNHSWNHPDLTKLPDPDVKSQLERTSAAIRAAVGTAPTTFRPPYGAVDDRVLKNTPLPAILWTIDTLDWQLPDDDVLLARAVTAADPGDIILLHDVHENTARMTPAILDGLLGRGFTPVTVEQMLGGTPAPHTTTRGR